MDTRFIRNLFLLLLTAACTSCCDAPKSMLLPAPVEVRELRGELRMQTPFNVSFDLEGKAADALGGYLRTTALECRTDNPSANENYLRFRRTDTGTPVSKEGYLLTVLPEGVTISSCGEAGLFYGLQTLLQLHEQYGGNIPAQEITDAPRFGYRGLHLDVSRHFFDKEFIKKQLRMMASLKLNHLHWHLTDGIGWRVPIDRYPLLIEAAARRSGNPKALEEYYTKDQIHEVVAYADSLHITVIPEIEMPGHSDEVLIVYPELGCPNAPKGCGELCIGNEASYKFVIGALTEVLELFPSEYIHIGGDEASPAGWAACPVCRARMTQEHLETPEALQGWFMRRVIAFLRDHNRKAIGWDEILDDDLPADAVVMSWRGEEGGRLAAKAGHSVIMVPHTICYLDYYQENPETQPLAMGGYITLEDVYIYDPARADMPGREKVLGMQANLWTEYIATPEHAETMLYPRLFAVAERAWSDTNRRNYAEFLPRVLYKIDWAQAQGYTTFDQRNASPARPESLEPAKHLAAGCPVTYATTYSERYPAEREKALTDGICGAWGYGTRWQGFLNCDVNVTIDLGAVKNIREVTADFMEWDSSWIWLPARVEIEISDNGTTFRPLTAIVNDKPAGERMFDYHAFGWQGTDKARYIRYHAVSGERPGGWLFTDEIIVR